MSEAEPKKHFTVLPNLIDELGLSVYAHRLYCHIKKVVGEEVKGNSGRCFQKTATLAKRCGMSEGQVSKSKAELEQFGLIKRSKLGRRDVESIFVVDIWKYNFDRNQGGKTIETIRHALTEDSKGKAGESSPGELSGVHTVNSPGELPRVHIVNSPGERHEEEPVQEEPLLEEKPGEENPDEEKPHTHAHRASDPPSPASVCVADSSEVNAHTHGGHAGEVNTHTHGEHAGNPATDHQVHAGNELRLPRKPMARAGPRSRHDRRTLQRYAAAPENSRINNPKGWVKAAYFSGRFDDDVDEWLDRQTAGAQIDLDPRPELRMSGRADLADKITGVFAGTADGEGNMRFIGVRRQLYPLPIPDFGTIREIILRKEPNVEVDQQSVSGGSSRDRSAGEIAGDDPVVAAIAEVCQIDLRHCTQPLIDKAWNARKAVVDTGPYSETQLVNAVRLFGQWYSREEWPGRCPNNPDQILNYWRRFLNWHAADLKVRARIERQREQEGVRKRSNAR